MASEPEPGADVQQADAIDTAYDKALEELMTGMERGLVESSRDGAHKEG